MHPEDLTYFSEFLSEFQRETDRGAALVGASLIETRLERLLFSHLAEPKIAEELVNSGTAPLGTLSSRAKVCFCLGLITEMEFQEINVIRRVRNEFAHGAHGVSFSTQMIKDLCKCLKANTPDGARFNDDPRPLFVNSVVLLSLALWYRPEHAAEVKAKRRKWPTQLAP